MENGVAEGSATGEVPASDGQLVLLIDLERCTGCRACEAACKLENRLGEGIFRNRVFWLAPADQGERFEFVVSVCQQCARPACLSACGAEAIGKDPATGVVEIDWARCTGCQECVLACPYGAIGFDYRRHKAEKCDLCADRRATGRGGPACAAACPGRAIRFGERQALLADARAEGRAVRDVDHFGLTPGTVYLERLAPRAAGGGPGDEASRVRS
jgi:Fe-S-cluster-containing dehydrogenase component